MQFYTKMLLIDNRVTSLSLLFLLTTNLLLGQQKINTESVSEITFLKKVKFSTVFIAGQDKNNIRACNGKVCHPNGVSVTSIQRLIYPKAKIQTIGDCKVEMEIASDHLVKYSILTKDKKTTEKLSESVLKLLGTPSYEKDGVKTWIQMQTDKKSIASTWTLTADAMTGSFVSCFDDFL